MSKVVTLEQLTRDMQPVSVQLVRDVGLTPQAEDRPLEAGDLLFYISQTTMPMAAFLQSHGLFMDDAGLHFDFGQFKAIAAVAEQVVAEGNAGKRDGVWKQFDLSAYDAADPNGFYILTALRALDFLYGRSA